MKTVIPIHKVQFEKNAYHFFIDGKINEINVNLLIDTGASRSVFDNNRISQYSKTKLKKYQSKSTGINAEITDTSIANIDSLQIGECLIKKYQAVFIDLNHVNNSYLNANANTINGIIGCDILSKYKAIINIEKLELTLTYTKPRQNAKK